MRLFKPKYLDRKTGGWRRTPRWYVEFHDHHDVVRRLVGFTSKAATRQLAVEVERLVSSRAAGHEPGKKTTAWLATTSASFRARLVKVGLLTAHAEASARPLAEHVAAHRRWLLVERHRSPEHVGVVTTRLTRTFEACGHAKWSDVEVGAVAGYLDGLRHPLDGGPGLSARAANGYRTALRQFAAWMVDQGLAEPPSPITSKTLKDECAAEDPRHERRPLSAAELDRLLAAAGRGPERAGMGGRERRLLYLLAATTGLRQAELRGLRASDLDLNPARPTVAARASTTKNAKEAMLPLRADVAADLRVHLAGRPEDDGGPVFAMPERWHLLPAYKADLDDAGIPYVDGSGRFADFHALRHTFVTALANSGVHPRVAQALARHSTIELTMRCYTHVLMEDQRAAVEALPARGGGAEHATAERRLA